MLFLQEYRGAPEVNSLVFNAQGKVITYTGGYVVDCRVGNTRGYGALFGILAAIGAPVPGSTSFFIRFGIAKTFNFAYREVPDCLWAMSMLANCTPVSQCFPSMLLLPSVGVSRSHGHKYLYTMIVASRA